SGDDAGRAGRTRHRLAPQLGRAGLRPVLRSQLAASDRAGSEGPSGCRRRPAFDLTSAWADGRRRRGRHPPGRRDGRGPDAAVRRLRAGGGSGALQLGTLQERDPSRRHHGRSARSLADPVQPHFLVDFAAFGPALVHFDVQEQVHRHAEHLGQFFACRLADRLDPRASLTEHDRLLAVTADDDLLVDLDAAVFAGLVALGTYRAVVGQLVVELAVELLAGDFGGEQALARVADLVFRIVPRAFGHQAGEVRFQLRHTVAGQGRDEEHFGESDVTGELLRQREQRLLLAGVDLVERQQLAFRPVL